jgi:predicted metal-binding protein
METSHTLLVCTACASIWKDGKREEVSGGQRLFDYLQAHLELDNSQFKLQAVSCMSACDRSCVIGYAAPGKHTYLFGDLPSTPELLTGIGEAIATCAEIYQAKSDGILPWTDRPELLKKGILAKIPPV